MEDFCKKNFINSEHPTRRDASLRDAKKGWHLCFLPSDNPYGIVRRQFEMHPLKVCKSSYQNFVVYLQQKKHAAVAGGIV
jgi:hypothetical protein